MFIKIIKRFLLIGFIGFTFTLLYIRIGGYFFINSDIKSELVKSVKSSSNLPDRFYELFEVAHPKSLERGYLTFSINYILLGNRESKSPAFQASYLGSFFSGAKLYMLTFYLEDKTSQKECLNFVVRNFDFMNNNIGIGQASLFYFEKELNELNDKEMMALIIMLKNPALYNPIRRPDIVNEKVEKLLNRLKK